MSRKQLSQAPKAPQSSHRKGGDSTGAPPACASNRDLLSAMGSGRAMPTGVRGQMESAFGADLSSVRLYESPLVDQGGAEAAASGSHVAFAPGKLNLSSRSGLELLGHELSHVVSQSRGEVRGSGVVNDGALERRADAEGAQAAMGGTLAPMGPGFKQSSGAVQCRKKSKGEKTTEAEKPQVDVAEQVESMLSMANAIAVNPDMDESEMDAYFDKAKGMGNTETMAEILRLRTESSKQLLEHRASLEEQGYSGSELGLRTKYSPQANRMANLISLQKDIGMSGNVASMMQFEQMRQGMSETDPEGFQAIEDAYQAFTFDDEKDTKDMSWDDIKAITETAKMQNTQTAMEWKQSMQNKENAVEKKQPKARRSWRRGR